MQLYAQQQPHPDASVLEERDDLLGEDLCGAEALRVQHDLSDQLPVRFGHGQTPEELLEVIGQVGASGVTGVHGDEDGHVRTHLHLFVQQLSGDRHTWTQQSKASDHLTLT